jgi:hypothetical protein
VQYRTEARRALPDGYATATVRKPIAEVPSAEAAEGAMSRDHRIFSARPSAGSWRPSERQPCPTYDPHSGARGCRATRRCIDGAEQRSTTSRRAHSRVPSPPVPFLFREAESAFARASRCAVSTATRRTRRRYKLDKTGTFAPVGASGLAILGAPGTPFQLLCYDANKSTHTNSPDGRLKQPTRFHAPIRTRPFPQLTAHATDRSRHCVRTRLQPQSSG